MDTIFSVIWAIFCGCLIVAAAIAVVAIAFFAATCGAVMLAAMAVIVATIYTVV